MPKAVCPDCETLVGISPTGEAQHEGWSAQWWLVDMHRCLVTCSACQGFGRDIIFMLSVDECQDCLGKGVIGRVCEGSGKRV